MALELETDDDWRADDWATARERSFVGGLQVSAAERIAWLEAISADPLLPRRLLPQGYRGREAWRLRIKTLRAAAGQMHSFRAHSL